MSDIATLVADNLETWTSAIEHKSNSGRGSSKKSDLYGIDRLRALILDLAIHGKLVGQCENDQPAAELLKLLPDEWPGVRRRKSKPKHSTVKQIEFELPHGWVAAPGTRIFGTRSGNSKLIKGKLHPEFREGLYPGFSASGQDVWLDNFEHEGVAIILSAVGARCGKAFLAQGHWSAIANTHIIWMEPRVTLPDFAMLVLNNEEYWERAGGAQPFVKVGNTLDKPFFLPPLAEQERIVAKVDELMALCDALERESEDALAAHQTLVDTLLATLVNSTDAADLAKNWARLEKHFDTVFTTSDSVEELKKTILDLAVSGKLLPTSQDPKAGKLSDLGDWAGGNGFPKKFQGKAEGEVPFLKVSDMNLPGNERQITCANNRVSSEEITEMRAKLHPPGTVIFPKIGGAIATNKRRILVEPSAIDNNCAGQVPAAGIDTDWLYIVLSSIDMAIYQAGTSVPAVNMKRLANHSVTITDEGDQKRLVAEVDKLLKLCEQLKSHLADATETQRHLADAIVERAAA